MKTKANWKQAATRREGILEDSRNQIAKEIAKHGKEAVMTIKADLLKNYSDHHTISGAIFALAEAL